MNEFTYLLKSLWVNVIEGGRLCKEGYCRNRTQDYTPYCVDHMRTYIDEQRRKAEKKMQDGWPTYKDPRQ